jgi:MoxR-like ATPase
VRATPYTDERLAYLIRLLRPAPTAWVLRAKGIFALPRLGDAPAAPGEGLTDDDLERLRRELESDPLFRSRFDADPIAATRDAGMPKLASAMEHEMRELVALAERAAHDQAFRAELEVDPVGALDTAGVPGATAERLLDTLELPDEVRGRAPDVVAHRHQALSWRAHLLLLLLGSSAAREKIRSATRGR